MPRFPTDWRSIPLAHAGRWLSGGTPLTSNVLYWEGEIPWISAASLKDFRIRDSDRRLTALGAAAGTRVVPKGTVLFVVRGMSLKSEFRIGITDREVAFGQDCKAIVAAPGVDARFLAYSLKAHDAHILAMVDEAGHGTGRLPTDLLARLSIGVPVWSEQRRIVQILDSVDESIRTTHATIAKAMTLRRGLLQQLLRNVEGNSEWRQLSEISVNGGEYGSNAPALPFDERLPRYVRITDIDHNGRLSGATRASISKAVGRLYLLRPGDLLLARTGFTTGKSYLYQTSDGECAFAGYLIRFAVDPARADPRYVFLWTQSDQFARWVGQTIHEVGQRNISATEYARHSLPVPAIDAQRSIVDSVKGLDDRITIETARLEKLKAIERGLTNDLLTGRVRVSEAD